MTDRPILDIDPFCEAAMDDPLALDNEIRTAGPLVWVPSYGFWVTGRDNVVREVFSDWARFSSAFGTGLSNIRREEAWRKPSVILEADPPDHTRYRRVLGKVLSPAAMRSLAERFQREAEAMVDALLDRRQVDLITDLAFAFPFKVLPDAVGLRPEERHHLMPYSELNFNAMGPRNALYDQARKVVDEEGTFDYVREQMEEKNLIKGGFGEDIYAAAHAGEISFEDAGMLVRTFISAGIDTTVLGIGLTLHALIQNPGQWDILCGDPGLARAAFDEGLRHACPSPVIGRTTRAATSLAGVDLGAEEKVMLWLAAANRDPDRWDNPDAFDITRRQTGHLAFGAGVHGCVGQMTSRLEAEAVIGALARRVKRIEMTEPPTRFYNNWLRGYRSMPVQITPA